MHMVSVKINFFSIRSEGTINFLSKVYLVSVKFKCVNFCLIFGHS